MPAKARSVAVKRTPNDFNEEDDTVSREDIEQPSVPEGKKQKFSISQPPAKKRRSTNYTPEFKAEILEFVRNNKNIVAVRQFGIPESTLRDWIGKAAVTEDFKCGKEEAALRPAVDGNTSGVRARMGPLVTNQDCAGVIVDVPGVGHADSKHPLEPMTKDKDHEELANNKSGAQPFKISPKKFYTSSFREKVVELSERKGRKAAGEKFGVLATTVASWARRLGRGMKSKSIIIDDSTKNKVVEYSKQMNSWKRASKKFGFSPRVVALWGKKAGIKLKPYSHADLSDEAKDEIVKYGVKHNSWNQAARKFGVPHHAVAFWGKKAGCKLKSKYPDGYKEAVVSFGEGESWKAAAAKFGVSEGTVGVWAKQMGKAKRVSLGKEANEKDEIIMYGVEHNSWKEAAHKFGVPQHAVAFWGKKAGYKLKPRYSDGFKDTVVSFGEGESWKAAAAKFGVSEASVGMWAKQIGKVKRVVLRGDAKEEIMKFGLEHNSWKEAANKFGVSPHTVSFWGMKAGYKLKRTGSKKKSYSGEPTNSDLTNSQNQGLPLESNCQIEEELEKENADDQGLRNSVEKFGVGNRVVFKWSKKLKVRRVDSVSNCDKFGPGQSLEFGSCTGSKKLAEETPLRLNAVFNHNIAPLDDVDTQKQEMKVKCEACGKALAADETLDEHVVSVHLTIEGLCNICGEDSKDFVDHFKIHLKSYKDDIELPPLEAIKKDIPDVNDNQNSKNFTESDLAVKEEYGEEDSETLKEKRLFINPFYSSS